MSKRVISFSLWGNKPIYMVGIIRNVDMAKIFYPDFECWIYVHKETVPNNVIQELWKRTNVRVIFKSGDLLNTKPMMWRFESIDDPDVEINMSRDCDTVILLREKLAVVQWIESGKLFHIMRDHPHHNMAIMGGMFGTRKNPKIPSWKAHMKNVPQYNTSYMYDQVFLQQIVYPIVRDDAMIHSSFVRGDGENCLNFPIDFDDDCNFVGQYIYEDGRQNKDNTAQIRNAIGRK